MNIMDIVAFTHEASELTIAWSYLAVLIGSALICGALAMHDAWVARDNGVHVKSRHRILFLASEELPCAPAPKDAYVVDPYNALYDTEFSYPEVCPPLGTAKEKMETGEILKKAA
ncbi:MAG: hypothetical protein ACOY4D_11665 [Pseudomonadota bacterium]